MIKPGVVLAFEEYGRRLEVTRLEDGLAHYVMYFEDVADRWAGSVVVSVLERDVENGTLRVVEPSP